MAASKKPKVTSLDVARRAGVSQSAVSRTFSKGPTESGVSEVTRQKVLKSAAELGYRPNAIARSLITQKSHIIALLFSYLDNQFYALALEKFCNSLQKRGYHALVFMMPDTLIEIEKTVSELLEYQVDGIITASVELSSDFCDYCYRQDVPVVMFNRVQDDPRLSSVATDNVGGGRLAARYLVDGGHERIALLAGWEGASTNRDREFGFKAELAARGVDLYDRAVGHFDLDRAAEATRELFAPTKKERPDAVFVTNDYMAFTAMSVLRYELGYRVPGDVSLIGFDDVPLAAAPEYDLTTIRQPISQMVERSTQILFDHIDDPSVDPQHLALAARIVERSSARRPGGD